jgi:Family of unknown function (DUF6459)
MLRVSAPPSTPDTAREATVDSDVTAGVCATGVGPATRVPSPRLRVRPIPDISPPVIDPRTALLPEPGPFIQGTLAISFTDDYDATSDPQDRRYFGPQRTLSKNLPEPQAWVASMAQALVEVMSGARPAPQVIRWTTPEVYSAIARRNAFSGRRTVVARRAVVRRVRICEPADGVLEACAVVLDNGRVRALAMRVTGIDRRWVVTALQVG